MDAASLSKYDAGIATGARETRNAERGTRNAERARRAMWTSPILIGGSGKPWSVHFCPLIDQLKYTVNVSKEIRSRFR